MTVPDQSSPDFDAAENYLKSAREAFESGDDVRCRASCRLVAIALNLDVRCLPSKGKT